MKKLMCFIFFPICIAIIGCGAPEKKSPETKELPKSEVKEEPPAYDPKRGEGKWNAENLKVEDKLNPEWASSGQSIANTKCASCHKFTDEKLVGPGWKDVTKRRKPEWIMNFITNPDPMLEKDPQAQAMLEICLVRMPNQNLSDAEARNILEFMRKNDGVK